ncbi:MAG TPA: hypothetical protein VNQ77_19545 [Frankiaceae bacterium]|nr:hypothetical protein [Frankiaceae bacterium]
MRLRSLVLCSLAVTLVATTPTAWAAAARRPKPVCNLVVDGKGDGHSTVFPLVESDTLDILGADVATGPKTLVAVARMVSTDGTGDNVAMLGTKVNMQMTIMGEHFTFTRRRKAGTTEAYEYTFSGGPLLKASATKTAITWVIDRKLIKGLAKKNQKISGLSVTTVPFSGNADAATSLKTYTDKYPSCVKAA